MASIRIRPGNRGAWGVLGLAAVAAAVAGAAERGAFSRPATRPDPLPGLTIGDDESFAMPVVTSLRSGGLAEREGVRVGDHIVAVDGYPVHSAAAMRASVREARARRVVLNVAHGGAVWHAAIDRLEPGS